MSKGKILRYAQNDRTHGFSLIELIVVVTIMAVITVIGVVSFSTAGVKARDGRRQSDLVKIQIALGMYYQTKGIYPTRDTVVASLVPSYLQAWPVDPRGVSFGSYDYENPTPYTYLLGAKMEDTSVYNAGGFYKCGEPGSFQGIVGMTNTFHLVAPAYALGPGGGVSPSAPPISNTPAPAPGGGFCNYIISNP